MESLEYIIEEIDKLIGYSIAITIIIFLLFLLFIYYFIASAVRKGVEDAIKHAPLQKSYETTFASHCVKEGIIDALEELDVIEVRYYDENGREIHIKRKYDEYEEYK